MVMVVGLLFYVVMTVLYIGDGLVDGDGGWIVVLCGDDSFLYW